VGVGVEGRGKASRGRGWCGLDGKGGRGEVRPGVHRKVRKEWRGMAWNGQDRTGCG